MICTGNVDDIPEYQQSIHNLSKFISDLHLPEDQNRRLIDLISKFHTQAVQGAFLCAVAEYDKTFRKYLMQQGNEVDNDF